MTTHTPDQINEIIAKWMPERSGSPYENLLDYAGNACLVQPMLDRCNEFGLYPRAIYSSKTWTVRVVPKTGNAIYVLSKPTLSNALTSAIVAMIEATSKGDADE